MALLSLKPHPANRLKIFSSVYSSHRISSLSLHNYSRAFYNLVPALTKAKDLQRSHWGLCCQRNTSAAYSTHYRAGKYWRLSAASEASVMAVQKLPTLEMVLFVECGIGSDQHGQNMTKAAVKACRDAIELNSIPCIQQIVPDQYDGLVINVKIGCTKPDEVDVRAIKDCFPYGKVFVQVVHGGLEAPSGVKIKSMGDTEDLMLLAVVAVTVGYGLRPEDLIDV